MALRDPDKSDDEIAARRSDGRNMAAAIVAGRRSAQVIAARREGFAPSRRRCARVDHSLLIYGAA